MARILVISASCYQRPQGGELCYHFSMRREATMPKINLSRMTVEALMDLRKRVDETLNKRRAELEKQLETIGGGKVVRGGGSVLKGKKVPPKYRGPSGETWAGRGAKPRSEYYGRHLNVG